ncbi:hypothetical protein ONZ45_g12250 [Pleurotus djamor]|nr:hypothetical protein ONZ45_g12250 [Pleurotus djamor]
MLLSSYSRNLQTIPAQYPPPQRIPPQVLNTMKALNGMAYATLPKELKGRRNCVVATQSQHSRFRSGKSRGSQSDVESPIFDASGEEIPKMYRRVEIEYSKFGVEDFDFGFFNKTEYSGLETHILHSYTNPLIQVMHYIEPIRQLGKSHITTNCQGEDCLLCELGFVVRMLEDAHGINCQASNFCKTVASAIELIDYGKDSTEIDYAHKIQTFHRFLIDHLSLEGNIFPHNPVLIKQPTFSASPTTPAAAPITQLLGIDAKNVITCSSCKAVREKENMSHIVDMVYPRKNLSNEPPLPSDFGSVIRNSLIRHMTHKATCQTCKQFATFTSRRSIATKDLPAVLAVNACISNEDNLQVWLDSRNETFLKSRIELRGQLGAEEDPESTTYELRAVVAQIVAKDKSNHLVAIIKVPEAERKSDNSSPWFLFNDFSVKNIPENEALSFPNKWKACAAMSSIVLQCLTYIEFSGLPMEIDSSILCRDTSISLNRDKTKIKHECLRFEELPKPGTLVAIDAEFVQMQLEESEFRSDGTKKVLRPPRRSLARVSVLRGSGPKEGLPFIDDHIHTSEAIVDYLTKHSGVKSKLSSYTPYTLTPLKEVYKKLRVLVDRGCIFIGHGLSSDFRIINIFVPPEQVIDTVDLYF